MKIQEHFSKLSSSLEKTDIDLLIPAIKLQSEGEINETHLKEITSKYTNEELHGMTPKELYEIYRQKVPLLKGSQ